MYNTVNVLFTNKRTDTIMKKRIISGLAALAIVLSGSGAVVGNVVDLQFDIAASAESVASGTCGENLTWSLDNEGTLTISGTGEMNNYAHSYDSDIGKGYSSSIKRIVIEEGVTSIGNNAFTTYCNGITDVTIPEGVTSIGANAFESCGLTSINLPDSVTSIGDFAFADCTKLKSVTIPRNVSSFGVNVFKSWFDSALESINVDPDNSYYSSVDGVMYNKDMTKLVAFPCGKTSVTLPDTLTSIDENAFYEFEKLESVIIPNGVKSIGESAFEGCRKLKSITIPESVESIGKNAFFDCTAMTSATLPKSNIKIGEYAIGYYYHLAEGYPWSQNFVEDGPRVMENFKIYCYEGTSGEQYAKNNKIAYELCEDIEPANPVVTYTPGDGCVTLKWKAVKDAEKYAIAVEFDGEWTIVENTSDTSFVLRNLKPGVNYSVAVLSMFDSEWYDNYSNMITVTPYEKTPVYPIVTNTEYNKTYNQFRIHWSEVEDAEKYGVAVYIKGKWKIADQNIPATKTSFTSPKLTPGHQYKVAVCAKVNGNWQTDKINSRAVTVTIEKGTTLSKGDVNGDGEINVTDVTKVAAHIKGKKLLSDDEKLRADVNGDGIINITDISKIAAHIKGEKLLS